MTDSALPSRPIVSSRHLAEGEGWELSEIEFGLIVVYNAFSRWMTRCMAAAGQHELSPMEILILHNVNHRAREKRLSDICFLLNIEDSHTVNYALKKLLKMGLIVSAKRGKEVFYKTAKAGEDICEAYRIVRKQCLLEGGMSSELPSEELRDFARVLRTLSGQYDQASRAAASL